MTRFYSTILGGRDRRGFKCGNVRIDDYIQTALGQDIKRNYAAAYALVETETETLAGLYTLSAYGIPLSDLPVDIAKRLPRYSTVPVVLIGWLARDRNFAGSGVGAMLLYDSMTRVCASSVGASAILAHAIDEPAAAIYRKHAFIPLKDAPLKLFLPVATAKSLIET